jgi:hypothetical protein
MPRLSATFSTPLRIICRRPAARFLRERGTRGQQSLWREKQNQVIPSIRWNEQIPNLRGICYSGERVDSGSSFYRTRELGPGAGPTHPIPPHDSNRTHP